MQDCSSGGNLICMKNEISVCGQAVNEAEALASQILATMTLEEKLSLCAGNGTMSLNAVPRVGLHDEFRMTDGANTIRPDLERMGWNLLGGEHDYSTSLPPLTALAASWDTELAFQFGDVLGQEARERGKDMLLAPGVNIMRTPLCGRTFEYLGEDPALTAAFTVAYIRGVQANDIAACVKHFACNNQEWNRKDVSSDPDDRTLREIYLPAFEAAIREADVLTVMNAYNRFRGTHCSHHDWLNNQLLKGEWGFKGFVVSDWGGVHDTLAAATGGTDVEMSAGKDIRFFKEPLRDAVQNGQISAELIDAKVRRVLYVMARIGKLGGERKTGSRNTPAHQRVAREVAEAGIVLLKNDQQVLPLKPERVKSVLVFGENAVVRHCESGFTAAGKPPYEITPLEGIKARLGARIQVDYMPMPRPLFVTPVPDVSLLTVDTDARDTATITKAWQAQYFKGREFGGEPLIARFDRCLDFDWRGSLPHPELDAKTDGFSAHWTASVVAPETGGFLFGAKTTGGVRIVVDGQPVVEANGDKDAVLVTGTVALVAGQEYTIRVEYWASAGGKDKFLFGWCPPSMQGGEVTEAIARARLADVVLIFTGTQHGHGRALEAESADRPNLKLPEGHDAAIEALLAAVPEAVVVNLSGAPV